MEMTVGNNRASWCAEVAQDDGPQTFKCLSAIGRGVTVSLANKDSPYCHVKKIILASYNLCSISYYITRLGTFPELKSYM